MRSKIKSATLNDLKDIQKLNLLLLKELNKTCDQTNNCAWSLSKEGERFFKKRIVSKDCCAFIALADFKIIGYLVGSIQDAQSYRKIPNSAEIDSFFVASKFRSKNIGSQLYQKFTQWCSSKNINRVSVMASIKNTRGIEFYRKSGFIDYDLILESIIQ